MSAGIIQAQGASKRRRTKRVRPMSEINITPFVDVMLVLLIIFMVTAPMLTVGVAVNEPETNAPAMENQTEEEISLTLSITSEGKFFIQTETDEPVLREELIPKLRAISEQRKDKTIWIRAAKELTYDPIAKLTADLAANGFTQFRFVHSPDNSEINSVKE
tara:strand:+ start:113 stop:595 length:483 start_codon:yes stop_codon:yes gene_type:complete